MRLPPRPTSSACLLAAAWAAFLHAPASLAGEAAQPHDNEQPIHIEADEGMFDPDGVSVLTGAVALRQGSLHLNAHRMTLTAKDRRLHRIVAVGNDAAPATFRQQPQLADQPPVHARAARIDYAVAAQRIELRGNAFVAQADQEIAADAIDWNIDAGRVEARSSEPGGVKLKWHPETASN